MRRIPRRDVDLIVDILLEWAEEQAKWRALVRSVDRSNVLYADPAAMR